LDWIVMKCLEKDRNRRYETADGLGRDVEHYLRDEPVQAGPPSTWYKLRKLAWRHKAAVAAASATAILLLLTVVTLAVSNSWIRQERARTDGEKGRADQAQQLAERRAEEIRQSLEDLKAANAALERGRWYAGQLRWDDANASFTKAIALRPDHAAAWVERGDLFAILGLWDLASADFSEEFRLREPDATARWYRHALLRLYLGDAEGYRDACLRMRKRFHGTLDVHFGTEVVRASVLAPDLERDNQALLELAQRANLVGPGNWYCQYLLGIVEYRAGHHEEAAAWLRDSLTGYPEWQCRALSYPVLAMAHHRLKRAPEARAALQSAAQAIERWTRERFGHAEQTPWVTHFGATANWPIGWWDWLECQLYYREATLLINGAPAPEDPRLLVLRARALAGMRRNFSADEEYAAALKLMPDDAQVRVEAHRSAAFSAIGRSQWSRAYGAFAKAIELTPDDADLWRHQAVAALAAGDVGAYRQACASMLTRFDGKSARHAAYQVVWTGVLRADAVADADRLLKLARIAVPSHHEGSEVLLAALYRAGRYDEAIDCFDAAARRFRPTTWEWAFSAMAHHRLGHASQARRCLAEANRWIDAANRQTEDDLSGALPAWGSWRAPIVHGLLLREAEELIGVNPGVSKQNEKTESMLLSGTSRRLEAPGQ
jgi:tetratricopeptide (TPR) repeat protein